MGSGRTWPALVVRAPGVDDPAGGEDTLLALLDDYAPAAVEDLAERPLPPGGLWDPTYPPIPEPPPTPLHWRVFFGDPERRDAAADALRHLWPQLDLTAVDVPDDDWAARSQASLTAVSAGVFVVAPPWDIPERLSDAATLIVIEPSMGFGTGHHATTRLCLRQLSQVAVSGLDVLDVGTGSGVLAMAAALCGARTVVALDVDADAIASAEASARLNPLPPTVAFLVADFRAGGVGDADVVLANLTAGMLTSTAPALSGLVRPGGTLIVSGFDHTEVDAVMAAFARFRTAARLMEDGWIALRLEGPDAESD